MHERIRVLHLTNDSAIGGVERLLEWAADGVDQSRFEMRFCTLMPAGNLQRDLLAQNHTAYALDLRNIWHLGRGWRIWKRILREFQPHIVHTHLLYAGWFARLLRPKGSSHILIHSQHYASFFRKRKDLISVLADHLLLRRSFCVVAISQAVFDHLVGNGIPPEKIVLVRNGIDLRGVTDDLNARVLQLKRSRSHWVSGGSGPRIGMVAGFQPGKGHIHLVEAARGIMEHFPGVRFEMAGEGPLRSMIMKEVMERGLHDRFQFPGFVSDILGFLKEMDLLVIPSDAEGFGLVACEAMAVGTPVVASQVEGLCEIVKDRETGFLFQSHHPPSLIEQVILALSNWDQCEQCIRKAYQVVRDQFDVRKMVEGWQQIYVRHLQKVSRFHV